MPYSTRNKQPRSSPGEEAEGQKKSKTSGICPICTTVISSDTNIECSECNKIFHITCIDMSLSYYNYYFIECDKPYYCGPCTVDKIPNISNMLDGIKAEMIKTLSDTFDQTVKSSLSVIHTTLSKVIETKESKLKGEINLLKGEFRQLSEKFTNLQLNNSASHRCNAMDRLESLSKRNNVVMTGVPKLSGENLKNIAVKIAVVCYHKLEESEIEAAYRIQPKSSKPDNYNAPIVIKFVNAQSKTKFYGAYVNKMKSKQFITSHMLGYQAKSQIYINHHMTSSVGQLFAKALKLKKEKKFDTVNAKGNALQIKVNGHWKKVKDEKELNEIVEKL